MPFIGMLMFVAKLLVYVLFKRAFYKVDGAKIVTSRAIRRSINFGVILRCWFWVGHWFLNHLP